MAGYALIQSMMGEDLNARLAIASAKRPEVPANVDTCR
jgi:hypothetical protein